MAPRDSGLVVLFVCTGNTCRSPLAAAALEQELGADASRIAVVSAGARAWDGDPAPPHTIALAKAGGTGGRAPRAQRATPGGLRAAHLLPGSGAARLGAG